MAKSPKELSCLISGAADGEIRVWNVPFGSLTCRKTVWKMQGHKGIVRGVAVTSEGHSFVSCGDDKTIKLWNLNTQEDLAGREEQEGDEELRNEELNTWMGNSSFTGIDTQYYGNLFATSGNEMTIWDPNRSSPLKVFEWGNDTVTSVKLNPVESHLAASTASDRSVALYDLRGGTPIRKLILSMKSNALSWNPMQATHFTVANEDHNLYTFDLRRLDHAVVVHMDFVSAVMDVDYSPTGKEFCAGSYDRSVRIFESEAPRSREVYHSRRMQRIYSVKFSGDGRFVLTGSDDTNIRVWKAQASQPMGAKHPRQVAAQNYKETLIERYKHIDEVAKIARHRHVPKAIFQAKKMKLEVKASQARKLRNRMKHSKNTPLPAPEKTKAIVAEIK